MKIARTELSSALTIKLLMYNINIRLYIFALKMLTPFVFRVCFGNKTKLKTPD